MKKSASEKKTVKTVTGENYQRKLEKKKRNLCRFIYVCLLVLSGVYATLYAEKIPKMLFFFLLVLPALAFLYTYIVYMRFRIWQEVPSVRVVKNQIVPYNFTISNEDFFSYSHIRIFFSKEYSQIDEDRIRQEFVLAPGMRLSDDSTICGKYRGTYSVGVESVEISDFLNLFCIRYPYSSKLKIIVWPRVVTLKRFALLDKMNDQKNQRFLAGESSSQPDIELRNYIQGDNKKMIHWKASARTHTLQTRKNAANEEMRTILFLDMAPVRPEERKIMTEDKLIELALAISKYYLSKQENLELWYDGIGTKYDAVTSGGGRRRKPVTDRAKKSGLNGIKNFPITSQRDFEYFYQDCVYLSFISEWNPANVIRGFSGDLGEEIQLVIVSASFNDDIAREIMNLRKNGTEVAYFYVMAEENKENDLNIKELVRQGVTIEVMLPEDEIKQ